MLYIASIWVIYRELVYVAMTMDKGIMLKTHLPKITTNLMPITYPIGLYGLGLCFRECQVYRL